MQAEGDEVAAKLLATRRETMRLRNKIKELKQQHAELRQMKEAQQQQLLVSSESMGQVTESSQPLETNSCQLIEHQQQQLTDSHSHETDSCDQTELSEEQSRTGSSVLSSPDTWTSYISSADSDQSTAES